jgi:hypothetical protein
MSDKLVRAGASFLERRTNRRGFLVRVTAVGTALAVAPGRYLLRPESAMALVTPGECGVNQRCRSGWTEFCCSLWDWGKNRCPSYTFVGGWWKCNRYTGTLKCHGSNHRFYIDCHLKPSKSCQCKCTRNKCRYWWTCCNRAAYHNCNSHVQRTKIVCRIIRCRNPGRLTRQCSTRGPVQNATCKHEASCFCGDCGLGG